MMAQRARNWRPLGLMVLCALAWVAWQQVVWGFGAWGWADWNDFMASGWATSLGINPYRVTHGPNMNPPALLPLFALLWRMPWTWSLAGAKLVGVGCFAGALWVTGALNRRGKWWLALVIAVQAGTSESIFNGQIYGELALLAAWIWRLAPAKPKLAGLLLGVLLAVKPNFGLVAVFLLAGGQWAMIATSVLGFALANVPAWAIWGPAVYLQWWHLAITTAGYINQVNGTFAPMVVAFGLARWWVPVGLGLVALAAWWLHCVGASARSRIAAGIGLGIVLAPVTWVGYSIILLPLVAGPWAIFGASALLWPLIPVFPEIYDLIITITNPLGIIWLTLCALAQAKPPNWAVANVAATALVSARRQELGARP